MYLSNNILQNSFNAYFKCSKLLQPLLMSLCVMSYTSRKNACICLLANTKRNILYAFSDTVRIEIDEELNI